MAEAITHIGKSGWQDHNIVPFAIVGDYVVVTNNRRDFLKHYLKYEVHGGLIVIVPMSRDREEQLKFFAAALDHLETVNEDLVNKLIEVLEDGSVHVREWTLDQHDIWHISQPGWP